MIGGVNSYQIRVGGVESCGRRLLLLVLCLYLNEIDPNAVPDC